MSEAGPVERPAEVHESAGALLRAARVNQGLHIAALAASIKVTPQKLEALESDRFDELPGIAFVRALAQTVCRALKIDAQPVLERLPQLGHAGLDTISLGLRTPFSEYQSGGAGWSMLKRPVLWAVAGLLLAAAVVYVAPAGWWSAALFPAPLAGAPPAEVPVALPAAQSPPAPEPASAPALPAPTSTSVASIETPLPAASAGGPAIGGTTSGPAIVRVTEASWVQAVDGRGRVLLSRVVQPGEGVELDGELPMRLTIGNAASTRLVYRGRELDLAAATRDNVARIELK